MAQQQSENNNLKKIFNKLSGQPSSYSRKSLYTFGKTLGAGSFGIVRYARNNETNEEVAVKIILKKALKGKVETITDELNLLQELLHPNIVGFRDWFESKDKFYIVTQLATGGELFDRIIEKGRFTEFDASLVIVAMLEAIKYLHNKNIVHRDLKPENILYLTPADNSNVVLADFGIAKRLESPDEKLTSSAGSFGYAAPEVILGTGHGKPCDIWSLGVITYTLLCGYSPFRSENVSDFIEEVRHNNAVIFHADYWKDVSKDARRFIIKALQFDPDNRPDAETLLNDKWLVSIASEHKELDLLPNLKENFNAKQKFKQAIEMVKLNNKIKKLKELQSDDDDDPNEINLFGDEGALISSDVSSKQGSDSAESEGALGSWKALSSALGSIDDRTSAASASSTSAPKKKSDLASDAFVQLVHAATNNKERVANYKDAEDSSTNN